MVVARTALVAALVAVSAAGAASAQTTLAGPPWALAASPNGITLRWYPDDTSEAAAHSVADAHCAATGLPASLAAIERDGSAEIASYRCR